MPVRIGAPRDEIRAACVSTSKPKTSYKRMGQQFIAGGSAGLVEICLMHPLDVIKTRFQLQGSAASTTQYRSISHCFTTMYRTEGFMSFYKGILPPIFAEMPKRAVKFFCFERYQDMLAGDNPKTPLIYAIAGMGTGLTEAVVINPFERVKVQLQSETNIRLKEQESTFSKARAIVKKDGFGSRGLNRGLTATLGRHGVWNCVYFGLFHSAKAHLPKTESKTQQTVQTLSLGLVSGTLASIANIPYDVAKSRIQGPEIKLADGRFKYRGAHQAMLLVAREEGVRALYKGLLPKLMRLGPSGAIMMYVYQTFSDYLARRFP